MKKLTIVAIFLSVFQYFTVYSLIASVRIVTTQNFAHLTVKPLVPPCSLKSYNQTSRIEECSRIDEEIRNRAKQFVIDSDNFHALSFFGAFTHSRLELVQTAIAWIPFLEEMSKNLGLETKDNEGEQIADNFQILKQHEAEKVNRELEIANRLAPPWFILILFFITFIKYIISTLRSRTSSHGKNA